MKMNSKYLVAAILGGCSLFLLNGCSEERFSGNGEEGSDVALVPGIRYTNADGAASYAHCALLFQGTDCVSAQSAASAAGIGAFSIPSGLSYELIAYAADNTENLELPACEKYVSRKNDAIVVKDLGKNVPDIVAGVSAPTVIESAATALNAQLSHVGTQLSVLVTPSELRDDVDSITVTIGNMYNSVTTDGAVYSRNGDYPQEKTLKLTLDNGIYKITDAIVFPTEGSTLDLTYTVHLKGGRTATSASSPEGSLQGGKQQTLSTELTLEGAVQVTTEITYAPWGTTNEVNDDIVLSPDEVSTPAPLVPASFSQWGAADIVEQYPVGPGVLYANVRYSGTKEQNVFILRVDLQNAYNQIEGYSMKIPAESYQTVPAQCAANSRVDGHRVVGGVNHDYFISKDGADQIRIPYGPNILNGMFYAPTWNCYGMLALNAAKEASVFGIQKSYQTYSSYAVFPSGKTIGIASYNTVAALWADQECHLYNGQNSLATIPGISGSVFVSISNEGPFTVNGPDVSCRILEISDTPLSASADNFVLVFNDKPWSNPGAATYVRNNLHAGDIIKIRQSILTSFGTAPSNIVTGFHGLPCILSGGAVNTEQITQAKGETGTSGRGRTMMGLSPDKRYIYIVAVDGPEKTSFVGTAPTEGAQYMLSIGCHDALNFDGGGSTEMVLGSVVTNSFTTLNTPSDGSSRKVINTAQVISTAPRSTDVAGYNFSKPLITSSQQLKLYSFNQYGDLLSTAISAGDFTFSCTPETAGTIDAAGNFTAGTTKSGVITAVKKSNGAIVAKTTVQLP